MLIPLLIFPGVLFTAHGALPVHRGLGHRRQARAPHAGPAAQRARPAPRSASPGDHVVRRCCWIGGGNDIIATHFHLSINAITWFVRVAVFVVPPVIAFVVTKRICLGLQRRDRDKVLHGRETGIIKRAARRVHRGPRAARPGGGLVHRRPRPPGATAGRFGRGRPRCRGSPLSAAEATGACVPLSTSATSCRCRRRPNWRPLTAMDTATSWPTATATPASWPRATDTPTATDTARAPSRSAPAAGVPLRALRGAPSPPAPVPRSTTWWPRHSAVQGRSWKPGTASARTPATNLRTAAEVGTPASRSANSRCPPPTSERPRESMSAPATMRPRVRSSAR